MSIGKHSISAFFPAYNDEGSIGGIIHTTAELLPKLTNDYEIVVVNDGSGDGTGELLCALAARYPFLKVIHHGENRGYGAALITGFTNCSKDLIFYTDGDGQYDVGELLRLLAALDEKADLVNGYKICRADPWYRILVGYLYQRAVRLLFGLPLRDVDCDFRLFRRSLLADTTLTCDSGVICIEIIKKFQGRGCRMVEVPVHHYPRLNGRSQFFRLKHIRRMLFQLFAAWWKFMAAPMVSRYSSFLNLESEARSGMRPE